MGHCRNAGWSAAGMLDGPYDGCGLYICPLSCPSIARVRLSPVSVGRRSSHSRARNRISVGLPGK